MTARLSETEVARYRRDGFPFPVETGGSRVAPELRRLALPLLLCVLAGCAPHEADGKDRPAGFYGGVSGGMSRP